ncbi:MAG: hypothetical protein AAF787_23505 [Chloroflexota bacterium]
MVSVYRTVFIRYGLRGEVERVLNWDEHVENVDQFASENGFPNKLGRLSSSTNLVRDARVYAAVSGVYPEFLLVVRTFDEWYCMLCWDIVDLYEAIHTFRLDHAEP